MNYRYQKQQVETPHPVIPAVHLKNRDEITTLAVLAKNLRNILVSLFIFFVLKFYIKIYLIIVERQSIR